MKRAVPYFILGVLAALAGVYYLLGPSFLLGGPKNSDIIAVSRLIMERTAPSDAAKALAASATITPRGLCNSMPDGAYACGVDVAVQSQPPTSMVTQLKKNANGEWIAGD